MLDQLMFGDSWRTADASGRRVELYGPWYRAVRRAERRRFSAEEFSRVREAMRAEGHATLGFLVFGPVVLVAGLTVTTMTSLPDTVRWVAAVTSVCAAAVLMLNGALGVPAAPGAFARAMLRQGRCPACAGMTRAAADGRLACDAGGCERVWRVPPPLPARERGEWECKDDRGNDIKLMRITSRVLAEDDEFKSAYRSIQRAAMGGSLRGVYASMIGMGVMAVHYVVRAVAEVTDGHYAMAGVWCVLALLILGWIRTMRWSGGQNVEKFVGAMLAHQRCPRCVYDITGCDAETSDGCTVCPECGAAWRVGTGEATRVSP